MSNPSTLKPAAVVPVVPVVPVSAKVPVASLASKVPHEQFYRVEQTCRVPRGAAPYLLKEGKVISSVGYDIVMLKELGVPLAEVPPGTKTEVRVIQTQSW
jgi:hypothetical protein